jgi:hypothetical protein
MLKRLTNDKPKPKAQTSRKAKTNQNLKAVSLVILTFPVMFARVVVVVLVALLPLMMAYRGIDVSSRVGASTWSCLANSGYSFAIVRVYQSNGVPDGNGPYTINDAHSGGISYVDGYIFPCYSCGDPEGQVNIAQRYVDS